jgi:hypothetical protein
MGEGDREDVRLFFEDRAQAREKFRACALAWISGQGGAEALLERWGDPAETDAAHSREYAEDLVLGWHEGMRASTFAVFGLLTSATPCTGNRVRVGTKV